MTILLVSASVVVCFFFFNVIKWLNGNFGNFFGHFFSNKIDTLNNNNSHSHNHNKFNFNGKFRLKSIHTRSIYTGWWLRRRLCNQMIEKNWTNSMDIINLVFIGFSSLLLLSVFLVFFQFKPISPEIQDQGFSFSRLHYWFNVDWLWLIFFPPSTDHRWFKSDRLITVIVVWNHTYTKIG